MHDPTQEPPAWHTLGIVPHASCPLYTIYKYQCQHPKRPQAADFYVMHTAHWVQALALTAQNQLVLVQQYRFGTQALSWETPGGVLEPGEDPLVGAQRELREETGYCGQQAQCIGWAYPNPALQNNKVYFVLLRQCLPSSPVAWDEHEQLRVQCFDVNAAFQMARNGTICHSLALNALFFLERALAIG